MRKKEKVVVPPNLMEGLPSLAQIVETERGADVFKVCGECVFCALWVNTFFPLTSLLLPGFDVWPKVYQARQWQVQDVHGSP
jgi:hypothetical protein